MLDTTAKFPCEKLMDLGNCPVVSLLIRHWMAAIRQASDLPPTYFLIVGVVRKSNMCVFVPACLYKEEAEMAFDLLFLKYVDFWCGVGGLFLLVRFFFQFWRR